MYYAYGHIEGEKEKTTYGPEDIAGLDYEQDLGDPGQFPYTRGPYPDMYAKRPWTIRTYAGFGTGDASNERFKFLLAHGQTGLMVAFDLPTQNGLDSDNPRAKGEVGRSGVAIDTLDDMELLFNDIDLVQARPYFTIQPTGAIILAMWVALADQRGISRKELKGTVNNDVLSDMVARGTWVLPPGPATRLVGDCIEWCLKEAPNFNAISLRGGGGPAFEFATALAYADEVCKRGYDVDDFAHLFSFMGGAMMRDFFGSIAAIRARRRFWARLMKKRGAKKKASMIYRTGASYGGADMTAAQPLNNIARLAWGALANVLAGVQSINLASYDESFAIPSEETVRVSQMIHQMLIHEMQICKIADPLGGSFCVEKLTNQHEANLKKELEKLEAMGGVVVAIEKGYIQKELAKRNYEWVKDIQEGKIARVGENMFVLEKDKDLVRKQMEEGEGLHQHDNTTEERQISRLKKVKAGRNGEAVQQSLAALREAAEKGTNTIPCFIEAVKNRATLGEMMGTLKEVFGEYREVGI